MPCPNLGHSLQFPRYSRKHRHQIPRSLSLCTNLFHPPPPIRTAERKLLVVPLHEQVDTPQMQPVLATAAEQLATSGLLWLWQSSNGTRHLCSWDSKQLVFCRGTLQDWAGFIGRNWIVKDTTNGEYLGPSLVVTDRLVTAVLAHPETPRADWAMQLRMKREAVIK